jgi:aspartyl-tRNA(Asn)/glutamyl-tRNA(Gln) amidotransferase subunit B
LVEEQGLAQVSDEEAIRAVCQKVIDSNPAEVEAYRSGKDTLMGWFVGQVMRETRGKADAKTTGSILRELL